MAAECPTCGSRFNSIYRNLTETVEMVVKLWWGIEAFARDMWLRNGKAYQAVLPWRCDSRQRVFTVCRRCDHPWPLDETPAITSTFACPSCGHTMIVEFLVAP